ncbi:uncharacterized protein LOC119639199 isoform X1 [Glossina fuscipes]|uniref:Uncharacterized protein LOC119639199 isoform X1 n=1 Tax=Glossina fuscipes TaxID=7396 RepID=A0A9C5Z1W0_9MUSC|nr:uncharacterized protein LOC119639199 isoform X1 [Glossina fuscipes]
MLLNYYKCLLIVNCCCFCVFVQPLPIKDITGRSTYDDKNSTITTKPVNPLRNDDLLSTEEDASTQANDFIPRFHLPVVRKIPRGFLPLTDLTNSHKTDLYSKLGGNFYTTSHNGNPVLDFARYHYPQITKILTPPATNAKTYDRDVLGSGDFGILRGGTFYPEDEMPYHPEANDDYYYSDASDSHTTTTSGASFVHKYTHPDEQFQQFRDFADLSTPAMDGEYSQYVVIYEAKHNNASDNQGEQQLPQECHHHQHRQHHPQNIFEQLQQIDEENAKKSKQKLNKRKLKLMKKVFFGKKYNKDTNSKKFEEAEDVDPLLALS